LQLNATSSSRRREGYTQHTFGHIYKDMGSPDQALGHFQQALDIGNEIENRYLCLDCLHQMGRIYAAQQPDLALAFQHKALNLAEETESKRNIFRCHEALAEIYESQGNLGQALAHYKQFHQIKEAVFNEESSGRLVRLEIQHKTETARKEAEIYQLKNVALEQEIVERKRLENELQQQANTDGLTGVMNRRRFLEVAAQELQRAARLGHPMSLALLDIDHFKQINDTYGHAAGDLALQNLARICQKNIREPDVFARFGGDEFALLLPEANLNQAVRVLERVRQALAAFGFDMDGNLVSITISAGVSSLDSVEIALDMLLARADQALYRAKEAGRNCVISQHASG
jgi:diguanylate cyclase (GGDEF)-like protein